MKYKLKTLLLIAVTATLCIFSSQMKVSALLQENNGEVTSKSQANDSLPAFQYHRYNIEPNTKTNVYLLLYPKAKTVKVEVIEAQGLGVGIDNKILTKNGLRIIKHSRIRNKESRTKLLLEEKYSTNSAFFNLQSLSNQQHTVSALDYKIFTIPLKGLPSASYTLQATVDDKYAVITKIFTKPDFRIDDVSPSVIDVGTESILTIEGKYLDSFTNVYISGDDIEIKSIESTNEGILKVNAFVPENTEIGFKDVTVTNSLLGKSATLVNGLYVGPRIGMDGVDGKDGMDGRDGLDGMGVCSNPTDSLMVLANNLPPGSTATTFFDPVLCNLTFGIPTGFNGINGIGINGRDGTNVCSDRNATLSIFSTTLPAGSQATSTFDSKACTVTVGIPQGQAGSSGAKGDKGEKGDTGAIGAQGEKSDAGTIGAQGEKGDAGLAGINCWDLNGNRANDASEDVNKDGSFNTLDCQKKDKDK